MANSKETTDKVTNMEVKRKNRNRIYRYMSRNRIVSNPDIAYGLKLSLPTVTQNTRELLELGLIREIGELKSTGGRKAKALSVAEDARIASGLDITRNHIGLLLTNLGGEILRYERIPYPFSMSREYFQGVSRKLEEFLDESGADREKLLGLGISIPGIVDLNKREITASHILDITGIPFREVESCFSCSCVFLNDANAGAYAEGIRMEEDGRFFYLSLSNTVGGAVFGGGKLEYGKEFRCGEVGHMTIVPDGEKCYCGKYGCLDSYCSAKKLSEFSDGKLEDFFEELSKGNEEAGKIWEKYTDYLAVAVNNIHMVLDCDIILGGYVGSHVSEYIREIRAKVQKRNTFSDTGDFVLPCRYQTGAAALGAALYVVEEFIQKI